MKAALGLEDGRYFTGEGFGVEGKTCGELVFTTQMSGYMEALTDPSYHGQLLLFTYPLIGNYGVDKQNFQSEKIWTRGCVVHELCRAPAAKPSLEDYFESEGYFGITGIDTRSLTISIREQGTIRASLIMDCDDGEAAVEIAKHAPDIRSENLIPEVSCKKPYQMPGNGPVIAVLDLGVKRTILESLHSRGGNLHVFPHDTKSDEILALKPDALFITNGPGDPKMADSAVKCAKDLIGEIPLYGICMGNQICALALGGETSKMKFGHRGANQPIRDINGQIAVTSQNHGFVVEGDSLPEGCRITYKNCNDGSLEGFEDNSLDIHCVQFHPEAHAGPHDTEKLFFNTMFRGLL